MSSSKYQWCTQEELVPWHVPLKTKELSVHLCDIYSVANLFLTVKELLPCGRYQAKQVYRKKRRNVFVRQSVCCSAMNTVINDLANGKHLTLLCKRLDDKRSRNKNSVLLADAAEIHNSLK